MLRVDNFLAQPEGGAGDQQCEGQERRQENVDASSAAEGRLLAALTGSEEGCDLGREGTVAGPVQSVRGVGAVEQVGGEAGTGVAVVPAGDLVQPCLETVVTLDPPAEVAPVTYQRVVDQLGDRLARSAVGPCRPAGGDDAVTGQRGDDVPNLYASLVWAQHADAGPLHGELWDHGNAGAARYGTVVLFMSHVTTYLGHRNSTGLSISCSLPDSENDICTASLGLFLTQMDGASTMRAHVRRTASL